MGEGKREGVGLLVFFEEVVILPFQEEVVGGSGKLKFMTKSLLFSHVV